MTDKNAIDPLAWKGFYERFALPLLQRDRFFMALILATLVALAEAGALLTLVPLHQKVPYIVTVNRNGQVVGAGQLTTIQHGAPTSAELTYWLGRWARDLYIVDPARTASNVRQAYLMTRGPAVGQMTRLIKSSSGPSSRLSANPALRVTARVTVVRTIGNREVYLVLDARNRLTGAVREHDLTISYRLKPPTTVAGALHNPIGLRITNFSTGGSE